VTRLDTRRKSTVCNLGKVQEHYVEARVSSGNRFGEDGLGRGRLLQVELPRESSFPTVLPSEAASSAGVKGRRGLGGHYHLKKRSRMELQTVAVISHNSFHEVWLTSSMSRLGRHQQGTLQAKRQPLGSRIAVRKAYVEVLQGQPLTYPNRPWTKTD